MTKNEHIAYWQRQSIDDWETVGVLFQGRKYLQALESNEPSQTHNLNRLIAETGIDVSSEFAILLVELNRFQLEGRYRDYVSDVSKSVQAPLVDEYIKRVNSLRI